MAQVKEVNVENRTVNVQLLGTARQITDVIVVNNPGNYAFPNNGDIVLILSMFSRSFAVGIIQVNYKLKTERKTVKDPASNTYVRADVVDGGGISIGNITNKTKLTIDNDGSFSLWSSLFAGIKFSPMFNLIEQFAQLFEFTAGTVKSSVGVVMRNIKPNGRTPIASTVADSTGLPTSPAVEAMINVLFNKVRLARLHIGHVLDSLGVPEFSSFAGRIRAILEVCQTGTTIASMKMDEYGNIELTTTMGTVIINGAAASGIILGTSPATALYSVLRGESVQTWCDNHTHQTSQGPTGPASLGTYGIFPPTALSTQVKID
jgi:hypothetical protein